MLLSAVLTRNSDFRVALIHARLTRFCRRPAQNSNHRAPRLRVKESKSLLASPLFCHIALSWIVFRSDGHWTEGDMVKRIMAGLLGSLNVALGLFMRGAGERWLAATRLVVS